MGEGNNCNACGKEIPAKAAFCPWCGAKQQLTCKNCGTVLTPGARFCHICGTAMTANNQVLSGFYENKVSEDTNTFSDSVKLKTVNISELTPWTTGPDPEYSWRHGKEGYPWHTAVNGEWVLFHTNHRNGKYEYALKKVNNDYEIPVGAMDEKYQLIGFNSSGIWMMDYEILKKGRYKEGTLSEILQFDFSGNLTHRISLGEKRSRILYFPYIYGDNIYLTLISPSGNGKFIRLGLDGNSTTIHNKAKVSAVGANNDYLYYYGFCDDNNSSNWYQCTLQGKDSSILDWTPEIKALYPEIDMMIFRKGESEEYAFNIQSTGGLFHNCDYYTTPQIKRNHPNWKKIYDHQNGIFFLDSLSSYVYFPEESYPFSIYRKDIQPDERFDTSDNVTEYRALLWEKVCLDEIKERHPEVSDEDLRDWKVLGKYKDEVLEEREKYCGFMIAGDYVLINFAPGKTWYLPKKFSSCNLPIEENPEAREFLPGKEYDFI